MAYIYHVVLNVLKYGDSMRISFAAEAVGSDEEVVEIIERKLRLALTRYSPRITRLVVTFAPEPTHEVRALRQCSVAIHFQDGSTTEVSGRAHKLAEAGAEAAQRASRVVSRLLELDWQPSR